MAKMLNRFSFLDRLPLRAKVNATVATVFLLVIGVVTTLAVRNESERQLAATQFQVKELTTLYFDSLNTMMLTGTMDQRSILRNKMLARDAVLEARVVRGQPVAKQFGPGMPEEAALDELDRRALEGEEVVSIGERAGQRVITVLVPFHATENTRGVNCLQCHNVPVGAVNGAVRIAYSLNAVDKAVKAEFWSTISVNLGSFIVGLVLINLLLKRWIVHPLSQLMVVFSKRTAGDTAVRAAVSSADEVGQLSMAFNTMADSIDAISAREHHTADDLRNKVNALLAAVNKVTDGDFRTHIQIKDDGAIGELASSLQIMINYIATSIEEKRNAVETLQKKVDQILVVVTRAAAGDLTGEIPDMGEDAIGQLARGVQEMFHNLNTLVSQVQRSGIQVTSSATEMSATARQQELTIADQAATTHEIAATATEISATTKELVNTMDEVAEVADRTTHSAATGRRDLEHMEHTMQQIVDAAVSIGTKFEVINEKARNINSVVTTITKVADQTNLLSLNAAIEAEKAGEFGYGFAVVATEIRRLADQTAVATLDIEQMVREMQSSVSSGVLSMEKFSDLVRRSVADVNEVGGQLAEIIAEVQALSPRFEAVQQGMHFQLQGADQIKQAMTQLNDSAQQAVISIRQSNAAIEGLNVAAHQLQGGVTKFRVSRSSF